MSHPTSIAQVHEYVQNNCVNESSELLESFKRNDSVEVMQARRKLPKGYNRKRMNIFAMMMLNAVGASTKERNNNDEDNSNHRDGNHGDGDGDSGRRRRHHDDRWIHEYGIVIRDRILTAETRMMTTTTNGISRKRNIWNSTIKSGLYRINDVHNLMTLCCSKEMVEDKTMVVSSVTEPVKEINPVVPQQHHHHNLITME
jgi:hypothetical protein